MFSYTTKPRYLILIFVVLCTSIFSQVPPVIPGNGALNDLFADSGLPPLLGPFGPRPPLAPVLEWASAGSNAVIDSVFTIDVTAIPDSVTYSTLSDSTHYHIPNAAPNDETDDYFSFSKLILWMKNNIANQGIHAQIYIPPGVYNFSDQIVMHSNISLKGEGSDLTTLRFMIKSDAVMDSAACNKDAILITGTSESPQDRIFNVGIEDLKIISNLALEFAAVSAAFLHLNLPRLYFFHCYDSLLIPYI